MNKTTLIFTVFILTIISAGCSKNSDKTSSNGKMVNRGSVNSVIEKHQNDVQKCYEKGLETNKELAGEVKVSFKYDKSGSVTDCEVTEGLDSDNVDPCLCKTIKTWKFSSSFEPENVVNYHWNLKPSTPAIMDTGLAKSDQEVIIKNQVAVVKCYEPALKKDNSLEGPLSVAIHLNDDDGTVSQCEIKQGLKDETVGSCVCDAIKTWQFSKPEKPKKVIFYTWNLKPEAQRNK